MCMRTQQALGISDLNSELVILRMSYYVSFAIDKLPLYAELQITPEKGVLTNEVKLFHQAPSFSSQNHYFRLNNNTNTIEITEVRTLYSWVVHAIIRLNLLAIVHVMYLYIIS